MTTLDSREKDVAVLVPAAGAGTRMGPGLPKALRLLAGEPLLVHAVRRLVCAGPVAQLVVAAPAGREADVRTLLAPIAGSRLIVVTGGAQRQQSVAAALAVVPPELDIVLVHDAARALVPVPLVAAVAAAVRRGRAAVVPALPVADTITQVDRSGAVVGRLDRSALRAVQTPQGFRRGVLVDAHAAADPTSPATDDATLVARLGVPVHTIPGSPVAMKITTAYDLLLAEAIAANLAGDLAQDPGADPGADQGADPDRTLRA